MLDNDFPKNWKDKYEKTAIFRVHYSLYEIRKCPICQKIIETQHEEAFSEDRNRNIVGFELR